MAAARGLLKRSAIDLLNGNQEATVKEHVWEKTELWKHMSLFSQTVVNNCINDKRRVIATLVGVLGCTTLIVTAVTLQDNVGASIARQYEDVYSFDTLVYVDTSAKGAADNVSQALSAKGIKHAATYVEKLQVRQPNGFYAKDAQAYIYRDSIVLTVIGILLGVLLGSQMGSITVTALEPVTGWFVKEFSWIATLVGVVGAAVSRPQCSFGRCDAFRALTSQTSIVFNRGHPRQFLLASYRTFAAKVRQRSREKASKQRRAPKGKVPKGIWSLLALMPIFLPSAIIAFAPSLPRVRAERRAPPGRRCPPARA